MIYDSFSQLKGLTWIKHYDNIIKWEQGKTNKLLPPIGATIDLTTTCNLRCKHCNAARSWDKGLFIEYDEVIKIIDYLASWRKGKNKPYLRSLCFAGGGEPTLHPQFPEIITYAHKKGFQVGISTNGLGLSNKEIRTAILKHAEFCGISFDSSDQDSWCRVKNRAEHNYSILIKGVKSLLNEHSLRKRKPRKVDLVYKFLITNENQDEILNAVKLAKELGFKTFFARPAAIEGLEIFKGVNVEFNVKGIQEQLIKAKELESDDFKVSVSFNRVNPETYGRIHKFSKCHSTPLLIQICADGYWYLCIDKRYIDSAKLVHWSEIKGFWGSEEHRRAVNNINLNTCVRCAGGNYNEQIENCSEQDKLFRWFP